MDADDRKALTSLRADICKLVPARADARAVAGMGGARSRC